VKTEPAENLEISIIMLAVGVEKFFLSAANSVLEFERSELIVVNPKKSILIHESVELLKRLHGDRIVHVTKSDNSPAEGLNNGLSLAQGKIVGVLNGDDFYLPGALDYVCQVFRDNHDLELLHGSGVISKEATMEQKNSYPFGLQGRTLELFSIKGTNYFHPGEFFLRTTFGKLPYNPSNRVNWDFEHYLEMYKVKPVTQFTPKKLAVFRVHQDSITGSGEHASKLATENSRLRLEFNYPANNYWDFIHATIVRFYQYLRGLAFTLRSDFKRSRL